MRLTLKAMNSVSFQEFCRRSHEFERFRRTRRCPTLKLGQFVKTIAPHIAGLRRV